MNERIQDLKSASERLLSFQSDIPMEFARKPRDLLDVDRWKATEFRQFLLYTGIVILKEHTSTEKYVHFLSLSCAIRILSCTRFNNLIDYAESLLKYFVKHFPQVYSKEELSYNVHGLLHLCNDVKRFGPLDNFSAFKFENFMYSLKRRIRATRKPLEQLHNRITELQSLPIFVHKQQEMPLFVESKSTIYFKNFCITSKHPDNCVSLNNSNCIVIIKRISKNKNNYIEGLKLNDLRDYFDTPCQSSVLGIFVANKSDTSEICCEINAINVKCVNIKLDERYLLILPLNSS